MKLGTADVIRADSRHLPLPDNSVDLVVTSPPYFALRSYQDGGEHYAGQIGDEPTPDEFVASLLEVTRECMRVLKPSGSLWVNLGDSYSGKPSSDGTRRRDKAGARAERLDRRGGREMTREQAAWLAGVIDSDGSVSIHINKQPEGRSPSFVAWTRIGQMRPEVVRRAAEVTGVGQVSQDGRGVWNWSASAQQARWVLSRIYPWLTIKQRQAAAAIEVARHVEARNGRGTYRPLEPSDVAYRQRLRDAVLTWNRGEDDDLKPPTPAHIPLPIYEQNPRGKSLNGIPWMYAQECIGRLGLILRAEVIWSKPNGLPESVTDRVRRSHEQWFHFTLEPRYFSAVDEIREPHQHPHIAHTGPRIARDEPGQAQNSRGGLHALGKLPGSVWQIPTEPLRVPDHLGIDHFAAFPTEWPKRIIQGWSPAGVCVECDAPLVPVVAKEGGRPVARAHRHLPGYSDPAGEGVRDLSYRIEGYSCQCDPTPTVSARTTVPTTPTTTDLLAAAADGSPSRIRDATVPTRPAVVLDPFGGTGTTALVAKALGRHGISVDMSNDYCRLAQWRTNDRNQLAKVLGIEKAPAIHAEEQSLLDLLDGGAA